MNLRASCYADHAVQETVEVVENVRLARDTYRVRLRCPEIARRILPGQFVMVRLAGLNDPLIGRPLALYDTVADERGLPRDLDLVYLVKGKLTSRLFQYVAGQRIDIWGPLGNGFDPREVDHLIMVAGGIGQTPFLALGQEALGRRQYGTPARSAPRARRVSLLYGARTAELLAGLDDFRAAGIDLQIATDDGTRGQAGFVTELLAQLLAQPAGSSRQVVCCGPEPMMERVAQIAGQSGTPCLVSLETPMACGIGICFSCVARVRDGEGEWDYKRTCVDGPVFDATSIEW